MVQPSNEESASIAKEITSLTEIKKRIRGTHYNYNVSTYILSTKLLDFLRKN